MKRTILPFLLMFIMAACESETGNITGESDQTLSESGFYGQEFNTENAIPASEVAYRMGDAESLDAVIEGEVAEVCKSEGCWLKMSIDGGEQMMVKMKDHEFFVPKDIDGRRVIIKGLAERTTTSVEELKHYAEDAGKSKEEIDAITEPRTEIVFIADGVKLM